MKNLLWIGLCILAACVMAALMVRAWDREDEIRQQQLAEWRSK
jgi:hypothetical protein